MANQFAEGTSRRALHAHEAVYVQAKELCMSAYEALMEDNGIFAAWKAAHPGFSPRHLELAFLTNFTFRFVPAARALLAARLQGSLDDTAKDEIYEALILDGTLMRGRGRKPSVLAAPQQTKGSDPHGD